MEYCRCYTGGAEGLLSAVSRAVRFAAFEVPHLGDAQVLARLDCGKTLLLPRAFVHGAFTRWSSGGRLYGRGWYVRELDTEVDSGVKGVDEVRNNVHLVEAFHLCALLVAG